MARRYCRFIEDATVTAGTIGVAAVPAVGFNGASLAERARLMSAMADADLDGVIQADHVSFRDGSGVDAIVMMAGLSGLHPTLGLFIGVYLLPLRHPVPVARSLATLAHLAPGRVEFGVGIGGEDRHEVEVCGVDPRTRGRRCDDSLEIVRGLLDGDEVTHHGEFFDIDACHIRPTPSPRVPVLVGGRSDAAIRRAGRYADGWIGVWCSPRRFATATRLCADAAGDAGRDGLTFRHKLQPWVGLAETREDARRHVASGMERFYGVPFSAFEKYTPYGTPSDVAEALSRYVDAGCSGFNLSLCGPDPDAVITMAGEVKRLLNDHRIAA
jgi:alkanesulfonate monooxygenase SsuD/methylene tetrahydromethanopterin reductase-like flavin-dependent oxidoreductase (luciferase family)